VTVQYARLSDVAEFIVDGTHGSPTRTETGIPVLSAQHVCEGRLSYATDRYTSQQEYETFARRVSLARGDLLLTIVGTIGRSAVVEHVEPAVFQRSVAILRFDKDRVDSRYAYHATASNGFKAQLLKYSNQSAQAGVYLGKLSIVEIPLPSLYVQRRFAAILDKADALRRKRKRAIEVLDSFTRALFLEMFGEPANNPNAYPLSKLGEVGQLDRGVSRHRPRNDPALLGGPHPLIQTGDVANSGGYITSFLSTYSDAGLRQSKKWPAGTLCITIAANIARTGILMFPACFPDSVVGFRHENSSMTQYVRVWLSFLQSTLERTAPTVAQKNINLDILRNLDIAIPPSNLVQAFGARVDRQRLIAERLEQHESAIEGLFASLQQRAFSGQL